MTEPQPINITIKATGLLTPNVPASGKLQLTNGATVQDVLDQLKIDGQMLHLFMLNGKPQRDKQQVLSDADHLLLLSPVGGG